MNKNQNTENKIHHILMITDTQLITDQLRKRLIDNSEDRAKIITPKDHSVTPLNNQRETLYHIDLNQASELTDLIGDQTFDTIYFNLTDHLKSINLMIPVLKKHQIQHIILILNNQEPQNNPQVESITHLIKNGQIPYLIIRTARLNKNDLLSYQVVKNAQPVNDSSVSMVSVADLAFQAIEYPQLHADTDLGIAQLPYK